MNEAPSGATHATRVAQTNSNAQTFDRKALSAFSLFRNLRSWHVLMAMLSALTLVALLYLWILHNRSAEMVRSEAVREVEALVGGLQSAEDKSYPTLKDAKVFNYSA